MYHTYKYSHTAQSFGSVLLNGLVFVYKVSDCGFESHCSHLWVKVFKNGSNKIYLTQPLKSLKGYGLLRQTISLQIFLKAVFHKFYFFHSWILWSICLLPTLLCNGFLKLNQLRILHCILVLLSFFVKKMSFNSKSAGFVEHYGHL